MHYDVHVAKLEETYSAKNDILVIFTAVFPPVFVNLCMLDVAE